MYVTVPTTEIDKIDFNLFAQEKDTLVYDKSGKNFILEIKTEHLKSAEKIISDLKRINSSVIGRTKQLMFEEVKKVEWRKELEPKIIKELKRK